MESIDHSLSKSLSKDYRRIGYVYIVSDNDKGVIKIGKSKNGKKRAREIARFLGLKNYAIWASDLTFDCSSVKTAAHKIFNRERISGEWFDVSINKGIEVIEGMIVSPTPAECRQAELEEAADTDRALKF